MSLEDETILTLVTVQMRNSSLRLLYEAGLWPIMRRFSEDGFWWYMRTQSLSDIRLGWRPREWRRVYMNLRSAINIRTGEIDLSGSTLSARRLSHLDTIEVLFELGYDLPVEGPDWTRDTMLCCVCGAGSVSVLQALEQRGWSISSIYIPACFRRAVDGDRVDMLALLIARAREVRAALDSDYYVDLDFLARSAAELDRVSSLRLLLECPEVKPERWPLGLFEYCVARGYEGVVRLLLEDGRVHTTRARSIKKAIRFRHLAILDLLLDTHLGRRQKLIELAIRYAVCTPNGIDIVETLLDDERAAPTVASRSTAFYYACSLGKLDVAKLLLERGYVNVSMKRNRSLKIAVRRQHRSVVEWLLSLLPDRRVWQYDLDLSEYRMIPRRLPVGARDRVKACCLAYSRLYGPVSEEEVLAWIERPTNLYLSLLQFLITKCPTNDEVIDWFKLRDADPEIQLAIRGAIFQTRPPGCDSVTFHAYRALLIVMLGRDPSFALAGLEGESLRHATVLIGAQI